MSLPPRVDELLQANGWVKTWEDARGQRWEKDSAVHFWPYWKLVIDFAPGGDHRCTLYHGPGAGRPEASFSLRSLRPALRRRKLIR